MVGISCPLSTQSYFCASFTSASISISHGTGLREECLYYLLGTFAFRICSVGNQSQLAM